MNLINGAAYESDEAKRDAKKPAAFWDQGIRQIFLCSG